ncbi:MAG: hypothetical protein ACLU3I_17330 [Acutalibacteraceae bacterium]
MQALAVEFRMQTAYEDVLPDELTAQKEAPEAEKQPEAPPEEPTVSVLSTDNRSGDFYIQRPVRPIPRRSRGIRGRRQI